MLRWFQNCELEAYYLVFYISKILDQYSDNKFNI